MFADRCTAGMLTVLSSLYVGSRNRNIVEVTHTSFRVRFAQVHCMWLTHNDLNFYLKQTQGLDSICSLKLVPVAFCLNYEFEMF